MAKSKDATNVLPVDTYRKQIGKQDYKKSKAELKESKARSQAKKGISNFYQDIAIMVGAMVLVMGMLYAGLYLYLEKKEVPLS